MKKAFAAALTALLVFLPYDQTFARKRGGDFVVATHHGVRPDGKTDNAAAIQKLIDENPNRTIIFPDGVYLISRPILTPADPKLSVDLRLAGYAIIKAAANWNPSDSALVKLGATHKANDIVTNGSNYGITGGIIDGADVADGISIDGGRETRIAGVSIKHTRIGLHIKHGANSGSSDSDVRDVNIVGRGTHDAIGVLIDGYDNTLTNMRIAGVCVGVWVKTGGNSLRNIHPLYAFPRGIDYSKSCGFIVEQTNNWLNFCYSDQFATGFLLKNAASVNLTDCFCFWYSGKVPSQTAVKSEGKFNSIITGMRTGFRRDCKKLVFLEAEKGGVGIIANTILPSEPLDSSDVSREYLK